MKCHVIPSPSGFPPLPTRGGIHIVCTHQREGGHRKAYELRKVARLLYYESAASSHKGEVFCVHTLWSPPTGNCSLICVCSKQESGDFRAPVTSLSLCLNCLWSSSPLSYPGIQSKLGCRLNCTRKGRALNKGCPLA